MLYPVTIGRLSRSITRRRAYAAIASVLAATLISCTTRDVAAPTSVAPMEATVVATATPPCTNCTSYTGTISQTGGFETLPKPAGVYDATTGGTHSGWLIGPAGADFLLRLQKFDPATNLWSTAKVVDVTGSSSETLTYTGAAGRYRWRVFAKAGAGAYTLWLQLPGQAPPPPPPASGQYTSVSAGGHNACATTPSRAVYCWGHGAFGQLGNGTFVAWANKPVQVSGGPWDTVSVGDTQVCALKGGAAWCWGTDTWGALGRGFVSGGCNGSSPSNTGCSAVPLKVVGNRLFTQVAAGGTEDRQAGPPFSRFNLALEENRLAWGWGSDTDGELGDGVQYPNSNPTPIRAAIGRTWKYVAAGMDHACGIDVNGKGFCWGSERWGEIGDDNPPPTSVFTLYGAVTPPSPVLGGLTFKDIDAGQTHSCGVTTAGAIYCWGNNAMGRLGTPNTPDCSSDPRYPNPCSPVPVRVASTLTFSEVTLGMEHACALSTAGDVWCWGKTTNVGAGTPASVPGSFACYSELWNGNYRCVSTPVKATTSVKFVQVDAGLDFTCAVSTAGKVYCWGHDFYGLAKAGTAHFTPQQINDP